MNLAILNDNSKVVTMSSTDEVDFINAHRQELASACGAAFPSKGFAKLEHKDFLEKVTVVLGLETSAEFSADLPDRYGRPRAGYRFPKREACLMAMSYSYELQAKVFDRMTALEVKPAFALPDFTNPAAAARAWADAVEATQALAIAPVGRTVRSPRRVRLQADEQQTVPSRTHTQQPHEPQAQARAEVS